MSQSASAVSFRTNRFLLLPKPGQAAALEAFHRAQGSTVLREFAASGGLLLVSVPPGNKVAELVNRYQASGLVQFAEPDYIVRAACPPNDPKFNDGRQWGLWNHGQSSGTLDADIDAMEAWSVRTSATNVIVAIVDTGIRTTHEDLRGNLWTNAYDGSFGTNAIAGNTEVEDNNGHGTQMAGIMGAKGNNGVGVAGVAWRARLMACKSLDHEGAGSIADGIACIEFARRHGAKIINLSWGARATDEIFADTNIVIAQSLSNAIAAAQADDIVFVTAAGNFRSDTDATPFYPASFPLDNIVSVAASAKDDTLGDFSNYGATSVDLAAPGVGISSPGAESDTYYVEETDLARAKGTSHAAAMVCGALALVRAQYPDENYQQVIARVLTNVDLVPGLAGKTITGGRLNVRKALGAPAGMRPTVAVNCDTNALYPVVIKVMGTPCANYVLETSANLADWEGLMTNRTSSAGVMEYVPDPDVQPFGFFRAYVVP